VEYILYRKNTGGGKGMMDTYQKKQLIKEKTDTKVSCAIDNMSWQDCWDIADYISQLPQFKDGCEENHLILLTVINELLENAFKYSKKEDKLINLELEKQYNKIEVKTVNKADKDQAKILQGFLNGLGKTSIKNMFYKYLGKNYNFMEEFSQIGLTTLLKDYDCSLDFSIVPKKDICDVVVRADVYVS
jgi:hypothetical protein